MKQLIALPLLLAACTTAEPTTHEVNWVTREGQTINMEACIGIRVTSFLESGSVQTAELACEATATTIVADPENPLIEIDVDYLYFMIPFGCEEQACWSTESMATGTATFDGAETMTIVVEPVINSPF